MLRFSHSGLNEMIDYCERIGGPVSLQTQQAFDAILDLVFQDTQEKVHVISGSLHNSGRKASEVTFDGDWEGIISYGGPSSPHNVNYAIVEMRRGGDHDFFRDLQLFYDQFEDAMGHQLDQ